jgi:GNAT superfamily N-acetyltransferase
VDEPSIVTEPDPIPAWTETVISGVDRHNVAVTGLSDYYPVGFFTYGKDREVLAGLVGDIWGGHMHVRQLWVAPALRGKGYAAALMDRAHRYAVRKSCTRAFLTTNSYEARPFYEKLGYGVYAEMANHPVAPHYRFFMSRSLQNYGDAPARDIGVTISMDPYPARAVENALRDGIGAHANAAIGRPEPQRWVNNFFLREETSEIVGGVLANFWGDWMYASFVWVDRAFRGKGYATKLMTTAEAHAIARGCTGAFLSTFSFQARPLYESLGYRVFGELIDYPKGHSLYYLAKRLGGKS